MTTPRDTPYDDSPPTPDDRASARALVKEAARGDRLAAAERDQRLEAMSTATSRGQLAALTEDLRTNEPGPGTVTDPA